MPERLAVALALATAVLAALGLALAVAGRSAAALPPAVAVAGALAGAASLLAWRRGPPDDPSRRPLLILAVALPGLGALALAPAIRAGPPASLAYAVGVGLLLAAGIAWIRGRRG